MTSASGAAGQPGSRRTSQRSAVVHVPGACALRNPLCDCESPASSRVDLIRALDGGGTRLLVRGGTDRSPLLAEVLGRAREEGFGEIVVRVSGLAHTTAEAAASLARLSADGAMVPLYSQAQAVHDRIAGRPYAMVQAMSGLRALAKAGLAVEIEVPLLPPRLQQPDALVELAHKMVPALRAVRFFLPVGELPAALAPAEWPLVAPSLARAIALCRERGIKATLSSADGVPLCALRDFPDLYDAYRFNPRARSSTWGGSSLEAACASCAVRAQCCGVMPSYRAANGDRGLAPYAQRPPLMYEQRTTRRREWTDEQRRAAAKVELVVLRPTVNCNQDCTFCSANETSNNVWTDRGAMLREIARVARRGVPRISFSGGEPTLSRDLVAYVRAARRLGIRDVELVTNAVLLDSEKRVRELRDAGVNKAFVSLHAHDERLSQWCTQKVGDFERTVRGVKLLLDHQVATALNHVITARNYPYLEQYVEFAHREFGGRAKISFAFVTPQYKALENLDLIPRLSDVVPYLRRAMARAVTLGQPFIVGSRQGVPPCFLGEYRGWSDALSLGANAISEDQPQKQRAPACDGCRYGRVCAGLWRPYVGKYGLDELRPVAGAPFTDEEVEEIRRRAMAPPWGVPMSFDEVPEPLRDRAAEAAAREQPEPAPPVRPTVNLPLLAPVRSRPLRLLLVGSGRQARRIARAVRELPGLSLDAVASPHAPEGDLRDFGHCPTYRDAAEALDGIRPEAVIIAAATEAHVELARLAMARGVAALLEKPIARTEEEGAALVAEAAERGALIVPAHNGLHVPGLDEVLAAGSGALTLLRRRTPSSEDAPRLWGRGFLFETVYHALVLVGRGCGGGVPEVAKAHWRGDARPERLRLELRYERAPADLVIDFAAAVDDDTITRHASGDVGEVTWRRAGRELTLTTAAGVRPVEHDGNEVQRMLLAFHDAALGRARPAATLAEALDVMRAARRVVDALAAAGAPFDRPNAPKHVASRALQPAR